MTTGQLPDSSATASYRFTVPSSGYLEVFLDSDADLTLTQPAAQGFEETAISGSGGVSLVNPQVTSGEYSVEVSGLGLSEAADFQLGVYFSEEEVSDDDLLPPDEDLFVNTAGQVNLVRASKGNYLLESPEGNLLELTYEGERMGTVPGWEYVGANAGETQPYEILLKSTQPGGGYALWEIDGEGAIVGGKSLNEARVRELEDSWVGAGAATDLDLDGDGSTGVPPPTALELAGSVELYEDYEGNYLLQGSEGLLNLTYQGDRMGALAGWEYVGANAGETQPYEILLKSTRPGGGYALWEINGEGAIVGGKSLNEAQVEVRELRQGSDLNNDGRIGPRIPEDRPTGTPSGDPAGIFDESLWDNASWGE